jgi:hypothetical protein
VPVVEASSCLTPPHVIIIHTKQTPIKRFGYADVYHSLDHRSDSARAWPVCVRRKDAVSRHMETHQETSMRTTSPRLTLSCTRKKLLQSRLVALLYKKLPEATTGHEQGLEGGVHREKAASLHAVYCEVYSTFATFHFQDVRFGHQESSNALH